MRALLVTIAMLVGLANTLLYSVFGVRSWRAFSFRLLFLGSCKEVSEVTSSVAMASWFRRCALAEYR